MDRELRQAITRRISERKRELEDVEDMRAHIEALAEVFDVDVEEIEAIVSEVRLERVRESGAVRAPAETLRRYQVLIGLVVAAVVVAGALLALAPSFDVALPGRAVEPSASSNARPYVQASRLAGLLSSITPLRVMMTEYYMQEGVYPSRLEDLGLRREDMRTGQYIEDLTLGPDGAILVKADRTLGEALYLSLSPRQTMGGLNVEWRCVMNVAVHTQSFCELGDLADIASRF